MDLGSVYNKSCKFLTVSFMFKILFMEEIIPQNNIRNLSTIFRFTINYFFVKYIREKLIIASLFRLRRTNCNM